MAQKVLNRERETLAIGSPPLGHAHKLETKV